MAHTKKWEQRTVRRPPQKQSGVKQPTPGWVHVQSGMDGSETELMCFGVNLHDCEWESTGQTVTVKDPLHGELHEFRVTAVTIRGKRRLFAYGEYCMCIFGLYAYQY